ncbi:copper resistance CopC/CopD family protein [Mycolicibacterium mageritense]|uniref:copper resistance CopC/CopD family protein n=1 Tax=Mycolicibacterium mageritense TaxID=53462 RepID=UPI0011DB8327|nr:copper resistance protein CopC [Mycolicibacterium mageritense]TXI52813.1 MAG: copper resistance protein CopC [Mycolicibacterium mageritense]
MITARVRRTAGLLGGVLVTLSILALVAAGPVAAHPTLLFTEPASDTAVAVAPGAISLKFNESVSIGADALVLLDEEGRAVAISPPTTSDGGQVLTARLSAPVPPGSYTVRWRVTGTDGDLVEDQFRFGVGYALTAASPGVGTPSTAWRSAGLRWVLFAGFAIAFGGLIAERFIVSARAEKPQLAVPLSPITGALAASVAAIVGLSVQWVTEAGRLDALWRTGTGAVLLVEAAGVVAALALTRMRARAWALLPLLLVVGAEGWRSHVHSAVGAWGAVLTAVHLSAAAVWVGALVTTMLAVLSWGRDTAAVRWVLGGYLRLAMWTFAVVIGTGVLSALVLLPLPQVLSTTYGRMLLVKLGLVLTAALLAVVARGTHRDEARIPMLSRVIRGESFTLIVVLGLSATLVSTPPVRGAVQPTPPPPRGAVLPLGALAGQIGIAVAASDGQLVVRLSAPRRGDYYAGEPERAYTLSGRLDRPGGRDIVLDFRGCGQGCFVSETAWGHGENVLSLAAGADDAQGASVSLLVPWPPSPAAADLVRAVAATRAAGEMTVYESVTSDSTTPAGEPKPLELSAEFFLSQEPYADGTAPQVVRLAGNGPTRVALRLSRVS